MTTNKKKILFLTGSMNQTTQMHAIAKNLPEYDCWFSHLYTDSRLINFIIHRTHFLDGTVLGNPWRRKAEYYCRKHNLQMDYRCRRGPYDLVICCTDLMLAKNVLSTKTVWIQEGMIDRYTLKSKIVKFLSLPGWVCGVTSLNGSLNICDIYCVASEGYKTVLYKKGTSSERIVVTGIPNHDNATTFLNNNFPYQGYVMVATSDIRETFRYENRVAFIKRAVKIANGRQLLFKLHPNENYLRAIIEIRKHTPPNTLIFQDGKSDEMIANCEELITQYSSLVYTGMSLNKKVHSYFDADRLKDLLPIQNNGSSAKNIANVCRNFLDLNTLSTQPFEHLKKERVSYLNKLVANLFLILVIKLQPLIFLLR